MLKYLYKYQYYDNKKVKKLQWDFNSILK